MAEPDAQSLLQSKVADLVARSGFPMQSQELERMEAADFGMGNLLVEGVQIITLFATDRISMKLLVQFPMQTEPEHWHPPSGEDPGKEEVLRVLWGHLYVYTPGDCDSDSIRIPQGKESVYRCRRETILARGEQIILPAGPPHWFRAGDQGAVFLSIATCVRDAEDGFTDPAVRRMAPPTLPTVEEIRFALHNSAV